MILSVGCSWTYGTGVEPNETYSAYLQDMLGIPVVNAGKAGSDIEYSIWSTYRLLHEYDIRLVIFQLTTLDRMTFSVDGKNNFLDNQYHNGNGQTLFIEDEKNIRFYGIGENELEYITVASYLESLEKSDDRSRAIKYLNENVVFSNLKQEKISMQLQLLTSHLENKNINIVFFPWLPWRQDFSRTLDPIKIRKDSVSEFLGEDYYIDKGYHISAVGHQRVAREYIFPMIEGYING